MARSKLIFDPAAGLTAPDTGDIRQGVAEDWTLAFADPDLPPLDTEPPTPAGQLIDAETAEIEAMNAAVLFLANMFNPKVSEGRWQEALGYIYFLNRKLDEPTVVTCQLTGLNGTVIPYGALAQSADGYTLICNRSVTIGPSGAAEATFRCAETGPIPFAPHSVTGIVTVIPGWDTVDNAAAGAAGRDLETRAEFEARRYASVAANAHGSTAALYGAVANITGVLDCQVLENIGPNPALKYGVTVPGHGVTICVYGGEDAAIAEAIYRKKDNGADTGGNTEIAFTAADYHNAIYQYKILRPTTVNFWIRVKLGPGTFYTPAVSEALKQTLFNDFYGLSRETGNPRVGLAQTVYASRFYCPAMSVPGVKNILEIQVALGVNAPEDSAFSDVVIIRGDQEPVTSLANILVISPEAQSMDMRTILQKFWHFLEANAELARDVNQWRLKVPAADAEGGAERWITLSNGKRCKLDAEGNVTAGFKGFVGKKVSELSRPETELKPYSPPAKGYGEYLKAAQELGDKNAHVKAAKQFYKENLQNTYVTTTFGDLGEQDVLFTGKGGGKLTFDLDRKPLKAALIEDLPGILQGQNYAGSGPPKGKVDKHGKPKQREDYDRFHYFNATLVKAVDGKSKRVKVHVDVGQRNDSYEVNEVYHLSHDKKNVKAAGGSIAEAILAEVGYPQPLAGGLDVKESISQIFEFINLEIMEEGN